MMEGHCFIQAMATTTDGALADQFDKLGIYAEIPDDIATSEVLVNVAHIVSAEEEGDEADQTITTKLCLVDGQEVWLDMPLARFRSVLGLCNVCIVSA